MHDAAAAAGSGELSPLMKAALTPAPIGSVFDGSADRDPNSFFFGLLPTDNAGQGMAYMPTEGVNVLKDGQWGVSMHGNAANFFNVERSRSGNEAIQKYETQTVNLEVRRGVKVGFIPAVEIGVKLQGHRRSDGGGALSGFITDFEKMAGVGNPNRFGDKALNGGSQESVALNGRTLRRHVGGSGVEPGDVFLTVKALLLDRYTGLTGLRGLSIAARLVGNISTGSDFFSSGDFAGYGLTFQLPLTERLAAHLDSRQTIAFNDKDALGLGRRFSSMGASAGLEYMLIKRITSLGIQIDWEQSKWRKTGIAAFDTDRMFLTFGLSQAIPLKSTCLIAQIYGREDLNPARVGNLGQAFDPYGAPDFTAGAKLSYQWDRSRCVVN